MKRKKPKPILKDFFGQDRVLYGPPLSSSSQASPEKDGRQFSASLGHAEAAQAQQDFCRGLCAPLCS